jgi:hypothetical protein
MSQGNQKLEFYAEHLDYALRMYGGLFAQVRESDQLAEQSGGTDTGDAQTAFVRVSQEFLENCRSRFEAGDNFAVLDAMAYCVRQYADVPHWLRAGFISKCDRLRKDKAFTLEEAFGPRFPKNAKLTALTERHKYGLVMYYIIEKRRANGSPIDEGLFDLVADDLGLSMSKVRRYYYWFKDDPDPRSAWIRDNMDQLPSLEYLEPLLSYLESRSSE